MRKPIFVRENSTYFGATPLEYLWQSVVRVFALLGPDGIPMLIWVIIRSLYNDIYGGRRAR